MPSAFVRDFGIYIVADVSMRKHVAKKVSSCFTILRHLHGIRRYVSKQVMQSLVALVLTHLDYGNMTLAGLADQSLVKLKSVLNAAARLIFLSRKFDHVTPLLRELQWLYFPERINYNCWPSSALRVWHHHISPANSVVWLTRKVDSGCAQR